MTDNTNNDKIDNYETLPENLPVPQDDGACRHLVGMALPRMALASTSGDFVDFSRVEGRLVVYCYPMTGRPGVPLPEGWDDIPGARGCTPQTCAFRDQYAELQALGVSLFGLSSQTTEYQKELAERLHLPFDIVSDKDLSFCRALGLPNFTVEGKILIKRVTLIAQDGRIEAVHYPVFPTNSDPEWVIAHLKQNPLKRNPLRQNP